MFVKSASRGQTMVELVCVMPVALFCLFALIYVARFGTLAEHAELALRYGGLTAYNSSNVYSIADIYSNISTPSSTPGPCPTPPTTVLTGGGPFPGPSPQPFFRPDTDVVTPSSSCSVTIYSLGGAQFLATHYVTATTVSVKAAVDVPSFIQKLIGSSATVQTTANFAHSATPELVMYCSSEVYDRMWNAINADSTAATPPPAPSNTGACH